MQDIDMDYPDDETLNDMTAACRPYLMRAMADGTFRAWIASIGNRVVGGGAVVISPWPSHPNDLGCRRATILNVYTDREYRRQGVARKLMQTIIDWCRKEGFAFVALHASKNGRPLYEQLGFRPTDEMRLDLELSSE